MSKALTGAGHSLVAVQDNLIDVVWTERPERPSTQLRTLGPERTGECGGCGEDSADGGRSWRDSGRVCAPPGLSWQDKVTALRAKMAERKVSWFVATALDEIACTRLFHPLHSSFGYVSQSTPVT